VKLADGFYLIDSPGIIPFGEEEFDLFLVESKNPNQLKDIEGCALKLIELLKGERFEKCFGFIEGELAGKDADEIIEAIARKRSWLSSGGKIDVARASREILEAYQRHEL
jgi:ribosome biogenesis GTPase A